MSDPEVVTIPYNPVVKIACEACGRLIVRVHLETGEVRLGRWAKVQPRPKNPSALNASCTRHKTGHGVGVVLWTGTPTHFDGQVLLYLGQEHSTTYVDRPGGTAPPP